MDILHTDKSQTLIMNVLAVQNQMLQPIWSIIGLSTFTISTELLRLGLLKISIKRSTDVRLNVMLKEIQMEQEPQIIGSMKTFAQSDILIVLS